MPRCWTAFSGVFSLRPKSSASRASNMSPDLPTNPQPLEARDLRQAVAHPSRCEHLPST
ncbi:MAG: hypothetical protein ACTSXK_03670 [Promethearchaeota archaeon]